MATNEVLECIRPLLARFSENEETVRRLVATDESFDALCHQYRHVIELLESCKAKVDHEVDVEQLEQRDPKWRWGPKHAFLESATRGRPSRRWRRQE